MYVQVLKSYLNDDFEKKIYWKVTCSFPKIFRYVYCEKCFTEIQTEEVELSEDPTQPLTYVEFYSDVNYIKYQFDNWSYI